MTPQTLTVAPTVAERRQQRAEVLAAQVMSWIPCSTRFAGQARGESTVFAIPSQSVAGKYHLADDQRCGCWDAVRRSGACKHVRAVRLVLAQMGLLSLAQPEPAADFWNRFNDEGAAA